MSFWDRVAGRESPFIRKDDAPSFQAAAPSGRGDADDYWYGPYFAPSVTGLNVSAESAMRLSTVFRCVKVLAGSIGKLPLEIFRKLPDGGRAKATNHPLWTVLHDRPNNWMTSIEFRMCMQGHLALRGNAYAQIVAGKRGPVDQLLPIHPDRVKIERSKINSELLYKVSMPSGAPQTLMQEEVFHLRGYSFDGIRGISPIDYQREAIGGGLAAQEFRNRFFANDNTPGGVVEHPGRLSEPSAKHLKESLADKHGGVTNAHSPMILEEGMKWTSVGITNRDAQFLESCNFSVLDVCRIFGVPPHMVAQLDRATYSNIEQQSLEFIRDAIGEYIALWEQAISRDLIIAPDTYFAQFDLDSLLRGDTLSRYQAYHWSLTDGWMNRNEVRAKEGYNREEGLDDFLRQANMAPGSSLSATPKSPSAPPSDREPDEDDPDAEDEPAARARRLAATVHDTRRRINEQREAA